jgi:hypothetical protein
LFTGSPATATTRPPREGPMQRHFSASKPDAALCVVPEDCCNARSEAKANEAQAGAIGVDRKAGVLTWLWDFDRTGVAATPAVA